ncbi:hypothetical protein LINPERPRIM_LOCUS374 [Linum perenne]
MSHLSWLTKLLKFFLSMTRQIRIGMWL